MYQLFFKFLFYFTFKVYHKESSVTEAPTSVTEGPTSVTGGPTSVAEGPTSVAERRAPTFWHRIQLSLSDVGTGISHIISIW